MTLFYYYVGEKIRQVLTVVKLYLSVRSLCEKFKINCIQFLMRSGSAQQIEKEEK